TGNSPEVWAVSANGILTTSTGNPPPYDQQSTVTWQYVSGPTFTFGGTPIFLGDFKIQTTADFPDDAPPVTPFVTPIYYFFAFQEPGGVTSTGGGSIPLSSVPEPASFVILVLGGLAIPLFRAWR